MGDSAFPDALFSIPVRASVKPFSADERIRTFNVLVKSQL